MQETKGGRGIFPEAHDNPQQSGIYTSRYKENAMLMELKQAQQLEYVLGNMAVGVVILDCVDLQIRYTNPYLLSLLDEPWCNQDIRGLSCTTILPASLFDTLQPILEQTTLTGERIQLDEVPYEGFLETRGRTYWRIAIERIAQESVQESEQIQYALLITLEDVTENVRTRLHLNAIHYISAAIAGPSSLHVVLDRILQVMQEMFGSKRCAVFLTDYALPTTNTDTRIAIPGRSDPQQNVAERPRTAIVAAHKGLHVQSQDWQPQINEHLLLGNVLKEHHTLIITDTSSASDIELPLLNDHDRPCRPGSALCVPIFEPRPLDPAAQHVQTEQIGDEPGTFVHVVLGSIEVYHRRARGFPAEEVKLLERFAQQAGLAIQNARLFRSIDRWARAASRNARQKENIMQAMPDGVVIYDPRWRVADVNHAARRLLGWSDDIIGLPITQAWGRSSAKFTIERAQGTDLSTELEQRALSGQIDELKIIGADQQSYTMRCSYTPLRDELGDLFAFIVTYHDVTEEVAARRQIEAEVIARTAELKQRNAALQHAQAVQELTSARMTLLLEHLPSGVILVDAQDNTITVINRHAIQLLQSSGAIPPAEEAEIGRHIIGTDCTQLFERIALYTTTGTLIPYAEQPLALALKDATASEAELHTNNHDGQAIHLLTNAAPLLAPNGTIMSAILVIQEISRIKTLERAREDFFTTMAHELKTPLANIRANLSALLARDLEWSREEQYDFLQTADEQVDRLVKMINHFLDASRVEAGALRLELEPLLIPEMLEDLQERLAALINTSDRQLQISLPTPLPAVLGDYEFIISVLINLLSNAFRYTPAGDAVQLLIEPIIPPTHRLPTDVRFSVIDKGPGISPEQQIRLFTRFSTFAAMSRPSIDRPGQPAVERQGKTQRWSPATGLGLYISRGIIEAHGSRLHLTSSPGQGATFAFTLPVFRRKRGHGTKEAQHSHISPA